MSIKAFTQLGEWSKRKMLSHRRQLSDFPESPKHSSLLEKKGILLNDFNDTKEFLEELFNRILDLETDIKNIGKITWLEKSIAGEEERLEARRKRLHEMKESLLPPVPVQPELSFDKEPACPVCNKHEEECECPRCDTCGWVSQQCTCPVKEHDCETCRDPDICAICGDCMYHCQCVETDAKNLFGEGVINDDYDDIEENLRRNGRY